MNCDSQDVIYKLACENCPKDYIWAVTSSPLRMKIKRQWFDINHDNLKQRVSAHTIGHDETLEECFREQSKYQWKWGL